MFRDCTKTESIFQWYEILSLNEIKSKINETYIYMIYVCDTIKIISQLKKL